MSPVLSITLYTLFVPVAQRSQFAANLIALRKDKGLSQRDLAHLSGISHRMIAYYETQSVIPPIDKLTKLASVLDTSVARLLDPAIASSPATNVDTRTLKKAKLLEKLPREDQRKVLDYIKALLDQNRLKGRLSDSEQ